MYIAPRGCFVGQLDRRCSVDACQRGLQLALFDNQPVRERLDDVIEDTP